MDPCGWKNVKNPSCCRMPPDVRRGASPQGYCGHNCTLCGEVFPTGETQLHKFPVNQKAVIGLTSATRTAVCRRGMLCEALCLTGKSRLPSGRRRPAAVVKPGGSRRQPGLGAAWAGDLRGPVVDEGIIRRAGDQKGEEPAKAGGVGPGSDLSRQGEPVPAAGDRNFCGRTTETISYEIKAGIHSRPLLLLARPS